LHRYNMTDTVISKFKFSEEMGKQDCEFHTETLQFRKYEIRLLTKLMNSRDILVHGSRREISVWLWIQT
jgi:hypothetical protein